ncbi:MAG TPA: response regulator [Pyrinomonadaceae bacterium]|nr:response regulator [Pyrinomonadaceae bacterium]
MSSTAAFARSQVVPVASESRTILIIEDYSDTRELLSAMLRGKGYKVIEAEDGLEGLLKATAMYPDLIIMDLSLPEMDGVEATRRIHSQAKLTHIPIFVVSAYLTEDVKEDVSAAGCVEVFSKPFDAELLMARISDRLGRPKN